MPRRLREIHTEKMKLSVEMQSINNLLAQIEWRLKEGSELAKDEHGIHLDAVHIDLAVDRIVEKIIRDNAAHKIILFPMDGALPYAAAILHSMHKKAADILWITAKATSYQGTLCGALTVQLPTGVNFIDAVVYVADDVMDTGQTSLKLRDLLFEQGAQDVKFVPLVDKHQPERAVQAWESGFKISPDDFIIGYGLDYKKHCRNFEDIRIARPDLMPTDAEQACLSKVQLLSAEWLKLREEAKDTAAQVIQAVFRKHRSRFGLFETKVGEISDNQETTRLTNG